MRSEGAGKEQTERKRSIQRQEESDSEDRVPSEAEGIESKLRKSEP